MASRASVDIEVSWMIFQKIKIDVVLPLLAVTRTPTSQLFIFLNSTRIRIFYGIFIGTSFPIQLEPSNDDIFVLAFGFFEQTWRFFIFLRN